MTPLIRITNFVQGIVVADRVTLPAIPVAFADDALTARNKVIVLDFYTTVFIGRNVDAAPATTSKKS